MTFVNNCYIVTLYNLGRSPDEEKKLQKVILSYLEGHTVLITVFGLASRKSTPFDKEE